MNINWLNRNNNKQLILFFNGWGLDRSAVAHLKTEDIDIAECNDYKSMDFDEKNFQAYAEIFLVAWSLGVWVASYVFLKNALPIKKSIAINGTVNPIDAKEGIHPSIFEKTLNGWNEKNRTRFQMRIIGGKNNFELYHTRFGNRTVENQKTELTGLNKYIQQTNIQGFNFNAALVGNQDAIFSQENQLNYWQNKTACKIIDMPHYPFLHFTNWDDIIKQ